MFSASRSGGRSRLPSDCYSGRQRSLSIGPHSRDSYGINPKRASSEERKSGNGSLPRWSGARSSYSNEGKGVVKETRPLTDKTYQKKKTFELVEFLQSLDFKPPITQAKLMQLSKKEFEMIFQFLVRIWEPTFEIKNLEIDAPVLLKNLGYPFIPNKSAFTYVARTSFPALLGILAYLMDVAKFSLKIDLSNILATGDSVRPEEHATVVNYVIDCFNSGEENEEEHIKVFERIIQARNIEDLSEIQNANSVKREKLKEIEEELRKIEILQKNVAENDSNIKIYEDYFKQMDAYKENKNLAVSKLLEELNQKVSISKELEETLCQKQALYDSQGFDGKKQLSYYEEHKKKLNETIQEKKAQLKELQEECWYLEMQHADLLEKGSGFCEDFNKLYNQIKDVANSIVCSLQSMKDPEIQNVSNSFKLEFPDFQLQFNQKILSGWSSICKVWQEDIQKKIDTINVILKTISSSKSEELTEIQVRKSQVSTNLKCATSEEAKKEQYLANLEKQSIEEIQALEMKCSEEIKLRDQLCLENAEKDIQLKKLISDLQFVERIKKEKQLMLETYLKEQKKFFDQLLHNIQNISKVAELCGEELVSTLLEEISKLEKYR